MSVYHNVANRLYLTNMYDNEQDVQSLRQVVTFYSPIYSNLAGPCGRVV